MLAYTVFAVVLIAVLSGIFVWRVVHIPVKKLKARHRAVDATASSDISSISSPATNWASWRFPSTR